MSLDLLRKIVDANPDLPDGAFGFDAGARRVNQEGKPAAFLGRVKAAEIVAAYDDIPIAKLDKKAHEIRLGSANAMKEQPSEEKAAECLVIVPIGHLRHLVNIAEG